MKTLFSLTILTFLLTSCETKPKEDPAKTVINPQASQSSIVEENSMCICTKEFKPVCGKNGTTYPNACQAGCDGIKEYTEGACKK